jgi:hypothetical protein
MTTNTFEIESPEGEMVEIEVEELSALNQMSWASKAPESIRSENMDDIEIDEDLVEFLVDLTTSQTILTRELLEELTQAELTRLFNGVVMYSFGGDGDLPERGADQYRVDDGDDEMSHDLEFNDDGSLDLDDLR